MPSSSPYVQSLTSSAFEDLSAQLTGSACRVQWRVTELPCDCVNSPGRGVGGVALTQGYSALEALSVQAHWRLFWFGQAKAGRI
jgi:hypothetical protein